MKRVDNKCWNHGCGILTAMFNELDGFWEVTDAAAWWEHASKSSVAAVGFVELLEKREMQAT